MGHIIKNGWYILDKSSRSGKLEYTPISEDDMKKYKGDVWHFVDNKLHSKDDLPSSITLLRGGTVLHMWHKHNMLHRDTGNPAYICYDENGIKDIYLFYLNDNVR